MARGVELLRILHRRHKAARLYLQQRTQWEIGEALSIDQSTVSRDLAEVRKDWQARATGDLSARKWEELARIDALERTYWDAWEKSCQDAERRTAKKVGGEKPREEAGRTTSGRDGNPEFLKGVERCIEQRAKILGILAPQKHEHGGKGGGAIPILFIEVPGAGDSDSNTAPAD